MRRLFVLPALLALAACGSDAPGASGPLAMGIVAGNHQSAKAGAEQLPAPVVGKLVRQPGSAGLAFHFVTPAYAQGTVVQGSPVAGAVVCAVSVAGGLEPFTPCTNTGVDGTAIFHFGPGTKAGEARSEIRGTVAGEPAVFDTVFAMVEPGAPAKVTRIHDWDMPDATLGGEIDLTQFFVSARDAFGNEVDVAEAIAEYGVRYQLYHGPVPHGEVGERVEPEQVGTVATVPADWCEPLNTWPADGNSRNCIVGIKLYLADAFAGGFALNVADYVHEPIQ